MLPQSSASSHFPSLPNGFTPHLTSGDGDSDQLDLSLPYYTSICDTTGKKILLMWQRVMISVWTVGEEQLMSNS